jgi:hypothetical protein
MSVITRSLTNRQYRKVLAAAPDYVSTLIGSEWLRLEIHTDGPALAWTRYDKVNNRFVVCFHESAVDLKAQALQVLWRHEIGHVSLGHFQKEPCNGSSVENEMNPSRANSEMLVGSDIHINSYIGDKQSMREIGAKAMALGETQGVKREQMEGEGYVDPDQWLPKIGLEAGGEYPYEVIHAALHQFLDEQQQQQGGSGSGSGGGDGQQMGACGGIEQVDDPSGMAEASASVVAGVASEGGEDGVSERWGSGSSMGLVRLQQSELPEWLTALENFARSIVEVVLANKRSHARPQEVYKAYDIHIPTLRPRWDYQPAQVCFLVDTSGSMLHELRYVAPVIDYLAKHNITTRLIAGDTRVTFDEVVTSVPEGLVGGGGTEITPIYDRALEYEPESIVFFTDGYVPKWPKDVGIPTLWVGCQEKPPWGSVA